MREPRGAGRGGGLAFLAVVVFLAYLMVTAVAGLLRAVLSLVLLVVIVALAVDVARRR